MKTTALQDGGSPAEYYVNGSTELATETPLTMRKLEAVRQHSLKKYHTVNLLLTFH